jgi:signal transduction histidine kinase
MKSLHDSLDLAFIMEDTPMLIKESLDGAERVKAIVQSLRNFAEVDPAGVQAVNINDCLDGTVNVACNELKDKAKIVRSYGTLPLVQARSQELGQAFLNILRNAVQAFTEQGIIQLKTSHDKGMVSIAITDNGCGIPKEVIDRVFDPFFTTRPPGQGTGLGLSTCYDVVKKHGGTIDVASVVGKGTRFTIHLPVGSAS